MATLYNPRGEVLSTGDTFPQHAACAGFAVKQIISRYSEDPGIFPDDVFILNDPYLAAIHQSDIYTVSPIHVGDRLIGWSATFVHVMDIGAMSPGGNSPEATEIFHEGLRIPGIKLVEKGILRKDVFDTITHMTRQPLMVGLDLKCEIAANNVAKARMREPYSRYGAELLEAIFWQMIEYSHSVLERRIREIQDGAWTDSGTIQIESDEAARITLTLRKQGNRLFFDFTGTDRQVRKGINLAYHATFGGCFGVVLCAMGYDLPKNHGTFSPIEVIAPPGTVVNVQYPGPVSMNTTSGMFMVQYLASSVLNQMLAGSEKWNNEVIAPVAGNRTARHAGVNQFGRYYVTGIGSENALSGNGARAHVDGIDSGGRTISCPNVEWVEQNFPLLYVFRCHLPDSGGAGQFRGGMGTEVAITPHDAPEGQIRGVAMGVAGLRNSGQGLFGGYLGAPSILVHIEDTNINALLAHPQRIESLEALGGRARFLPYCEFQLRTNDILYMRTASGGGYGDPLDRDPEQIMEDVLNGLVSREGAQDIYGIVLSSTKDGLDESATTALRARLRQERLSRSS